ncbi:glycosyltransferase [uncultured Sulfitobacter sp.]|uniref:glycosyltransferase family protein n=1 Tax=uncultured Sulfitobacter sp. TaxID=191468 RepID=UPI0026113E4A|nr:glycosyltransferase [uncultured Sulfitobacter sp.]
MNVMIVVTHLLGTGHLARALTLARAFDAAGDATCVVSGGMPAPLLTKNGDKLVQLPPLRSDGVNFSRLLTSEDTVATPDYLAAREDTLLCALAAFRPDILITELFPFGRRILRDEFRALLDAAKDMQKPPLICASVRDILAPPSKPQKAAFADEMVSAYYDSVLVHSDEKFTSLDTSWPVSSTLRAKLNYTGYVTPTAVGPHPDKVGADEVIVSAGGGDVGGPIYEAAMTAAAQIKKPMRILVGGANPDDRINALRKTAPPDVIVEPARPDFRQMLHHAAASVSLCGYNTALDILQAGTPAVFIPFDEGGEVEQGLRASALSAQDGIRMLLRADLTAQNLCTAIDAVIAEPRRNRSLVRFDGAARTVAVTHAQRRQQ